MAAEGTRFTRFYSAQAVCSASRAAPKTGCKMKPDSCVLDPFPVFPGENGEPFRNRMYGIAGINHHRIMPISIHRRRDRPQPMKHTIPALLLAAITFGSAAPAGAAEHDAAIIADNRDSWTLGNAALDLRLAFKDGSLALTGLVNRAAGMDYLAGRPATPLFVHTVDGTRVAADDGKWKLDGAKPADITLFGKSWGRRLEITLSRAEPVAMSIRQVFEIYDGDAGLRMLSFIRNGRDKEVTIQDSEILRLEVPDTIGATPPAVHFVEGISRWKTAGKVARGGRNALIEYTAGHGLFVSPENNWSTCIEAGGSKGIATEKMLYVDAFAGGSPSLRVWTNPKAVQLTLFPKEEIEYFAVNLGVFKGDAQDGRFATEEHLRQRFKFIGPMHQLATNDWQWGNHTRSEKIYREHVIPKAAAGGFDRVNIDDFWYLPEDSCTPHKNWTPDMAALCAEMVRQGLKPGHWFSLQGKWCINGWGQGRDAADPANIDFKLKQMREIMIGQYQTRWDQVDAGLLWKTDKSTAYSHPMDSVYRKILGMKRYMNTIAADYPDFLMQVTCEIDNPSGAGGAASRGNQNVGLIHLAENGIVGMFRRTDAGDDVRDLFDCHGLFPLEGLLSTWGEDRISASSWQDSPLWYYQFLLARHTMIYSRPWEWSAESIAHLRLFNDWRKSPDIARVLDAPMRPVYNGLDWQKNEGPWCWSFHDKIGGRMLVLAVNHLDLNTDNDFAAKLRGLDPAKVYAVTDVTMLPGGKFRKEPVGTFSGSALREIGLPVALDANPEPCAAYWLEEKPGATADDTSLQKARAAGISRVAAIAAFAARDLTTGGAWNGKYGAKAAWFPAAKIEPANGFSIKTRGATEHVWGIASDRAHVLDVPSGLVGPDGRPVPKKAACWTAAESFKQEVRAQSPGPYRLSIYLMDYDIRNPADARALEVRVTAKDGRVLDTQKAAVAETAKGVYLTWTVTGSVVLEVKKSAGFNAVSSGVFVDIP